MWDIKASICGVWCLNLCDCTFLGITSQCDYIITSYIYLSHTFHCDSCAPPSAIYIGEGLTSCIHLGGYQILPFVAISEAIKATVLSIVDLDN